MKSVCSIIITLLLSISCCLFLCSCGKTTSEGEIQEKQARKIASSYLSDFERNLVTNPDNPVSEKIKIGKTVNVFLDGERKELANIDVWVMTYTAKQGNCKGPITLYIDSNNGTVYGYGEHY